MVGRPNRLFWRDDSGASQVESHLHCQVVQRLADNGILAVVNPTSRALDALGVEEIGGALTLGLAHYSTMAEVDHLVRSLASLG